MTNLNFEGAAVGVIAFLIIGVFHPIVIKSEYYFTDRIWPVFLVVGILVIAGSFFVSNSLLAAILGVLGCSCIWSIRELHEQRERVEKGWFPSNPNRKED